jgi:hypothetical protein
MSREIDIAWAAGLFEGEGSIYIASIRKYRYPRLQVTSTDRDVLEKFISIVKYGRIYSNGHVRSNRMGNKQKHWIQISNIGECRYVVREFWPYLCSRRRQQAIDCDISPDGGIADTSALKAADLNDREGATPSPGTILIIP